MGVRIGRSAVTSGRVYWCLPRPLFAAARGKAMDFVLMDWNT